MAGPEAISPDPDALARFKQDLDRLVPAGTSMALAVSGGPDSMALLLLAAAVRPGEVEAVTFDHGLRPESAGEATAVAGICRTLGIPHTILHAKWESPATAIQERARTARYGAIGAWMTQRGLAVLLTGHHSDDQAETLLMRLARGAGVRGLAGMRPTSPLLGWPRLSLVRPLLSWRRDELRAICETCGIPSVDDPSNRDERFERARVRQAIGRAGWLDGRAVANSAAYLAEADEAIEWLVDGLWQKNVDRADDKIALQVGALPREVRRRLLCRAIAALASEGQDRYLRGPEIDRVLTRLETGGTATLRGVRCSAKGSRWTCVPARPRRG